MTVVYKCVNGHFRMKAHHFNTESPLLQFFYSFSVIGAYNVLFCILRMFYQYSHKLKTPILSFSNSWFAYRNKESGTFACVIKYAKLILKLLSKCGWYSYYNSLWCLKRYKTGILSGRNKKLTVAISANVLPQVFKVWGNYKNRKLLTAQSGDRKCKERASMYLWSLKGCVGSTDRLEADHSHLWNENLWRPDRPECFSEAPQ